MSNKDIYNDSTGNFQCNNMFLKCPPEYNYFEYISNNSPIHHFVYPKLN